MLLRFLGLRFHSFEYEALCSYQKVPDRMRKLLWASPFVPIHPVTQPHSIEHEKLACFAPPLADNRLPVSYKSTVVRSSVAKLGKTVRVSIQGRANPEGVSTQKH